MAAAAAITGRLTDVRSLVATRVEKDSAVPTPPRERDSKEFCEPVSMPAVASSADSPAEGANAAAAGSMPKFVRLEGVVAAPLRKANVDTDCIIPKQFLKTIKRTGLGKGAFFELRYEDDGETEKPDFVLNQEPYRAAEILIAMENFGCGSSREHAPWALNDFGIRCVIAPSFAEIFFNNCFKNGMLPITVVKDKVEELMQDAEAKKKLTVDLPAQHILREGGEAIHFEVDSFRKHCLVNGLDDIGLTLQKQELIRAFEVMHSTRFPWLSFSEEAPGDCAELRVSTAKAVGYYARTARGFLRGLPATDDRPARPPASQLLITATGAAIERAARCAGELEASSDAAISNIQTDLVDAASGSRVVSISQIKITMDAPPRAQEVSANAGNELPGEEGSKEGCRGGAADW